MATTTTRRPGFRVDMTNPRAVNREFNSLMTAGIPGASAPALVTTKPATAPVRSGQELPFAAKAFFMIIAAAVCMMLPLMSGRTSSIVSAIAQPPAASATDLNEHIVYPHSAQPADPGTRVTASTEGAPGQNWAPQAASGKGHVVVGQSNGANPFAPEAYQPKTLPLTTTPKVAGQSAQLPVEVSAPAPAGNEATQPVQAPKPEPAVDNPVAPKPEPAAETPVAQEPATPVVPPVATPPVVQQPAPQPPAAEPPVVKPPTAEQPAPKPVPPVVQKPEPVNTGPATMDPSKNTDAAHGTGKGTPVKAVELDNIDSVVVIG